MEAISSKQNPLCTHMRRLASTRSYREEKREFFCDSPKLLEEALRWGAEIVAVLYTADVTLPALPATVIGIVTQLMRGWPCASPRFRRNRVI